MTEQADLVLKGGRIIDPESGLDEIQDIAFIDGKVSAHADSLATMPAKQVHDVSGKIMDLFCWHCSQRIDKGRNLTVFKSYILNFIES